MHFPTKINNLMNTIMTRHPVLVFCLFVQALLFQLVPPVHSKHLVDDGLQFLIHAP